MRQLLLFLVLLFLPAVGQDGNTDFGRIGVMDITVDGVDYALEIGTTNGDMDSTAGIEVRGDKLVIDVMGVTLNNVGEMGHPTLSFRLPLVDGFPGKLAVICFTEELPARLEAISACAPLGQLTISDFLLERDGTVSFGFAAVLLRRDDNWQPVPGAAPVEVSGHVSVVIPAKFRE